MNFTDGKRFWNMSGTVANVLALVSIGLSYLVSHHSLNGKSLGIVNKLTYVVLLAALGFMAKSLNNKNSLRILAMFAFIFCLIGLFYAMVSGFDPNLDS